MIEKLLEEATKPFEELLNWQRCFVFLVSVLLLSPDVFNCVFVALQRPTVVIFVQSITAAYAAVELIPFAILLILVFYVSPKIVTGFLSRTNKYFLKKQRNSVDKLIKFSASEDDFFIERLYEIKGEWSREKEGAEAKIKNRTTFFEISLSFCLFLVLFCWLLTMSIYPAALLLIPCGLYGAYCSQLNVSCYLKHIAPYKISISRFQDINMRMGS